ILLCYAGEPAEGTRLTAALRTMPGLMMDQVGPIPFTRIDEVAQDPVDPLPHTLWATMTSALDDSTIAQLARIAPRGAAPYTIAEVRHVGGGARPEPDRLGLAHWSGDFLLTTISVTPEPAALAAAEELGDRLDAAFAGASTGMTPLNFTDGPQRVARAFTAAHLARLRDIKRAYDPAGIFGGDRSIMSTVDGADAG
ncbi:MAG TPA: BBE domain-containing protein, partial [Micromonosporaceae bacterium]|nr:BBE domain-containing protein [Micromonosporaceae bacterium]